MDRRPPNSDPHLTHPPTSHSPASHPPTLHLTPQQDAFMQALRAAVGVLDPALDPNCADIQHRVKQACDRLLSPTLRVTVFAPFNYGKSTLLNALLGHRALPIDLIPTTGAAIRVVYGESLHTTIHLQDGSTVQEAGTDILKQFAVLDQNRHMRGDVASVTVTCAHPLLKAGLEFVDLPGTDDQEEQDALVRDYLLTADVVVQVLDGRKLMTLMEREQLRDWLLDRGINQVLFVVNFLNLLEPNDQQEVTRRLRFVAESFRVNLPANLSNLYRVDALPALRARLRGNGAMVQTTGLPTFETALQTLAHHYLEHQAVSSTHSPPTHSLIEQRLPRILAIAPYVQTSLHAQIQVVAAVVKQATVDRDRQKIAILKKAQSLIQKGFDEAVAEARQWLSVTQLLADYQTEAAHALQQLDFDPWVELALRPTWLAHQSNILSWVHKACDFFDCPRPVQLSIQFPTTPDATLPNMGSAGTGGSTVTETVTKGTVPTVVAGGLGFLLGGPVGAALLGGTSYVLEKLDTDGLGSTRSIQWTPEQMEAWYAIAAQDYLRQLSTVGLKALEDYLIAAQPIIRFPLPEESSSSTGSQQQPQVHQLELLRSCSDRLTQALSELGDLSPQRDRLD